MKNIKRRLFMMISAATFLSSCGPVTPVPLSTATLLIPPVTFTPMGPEVKLNKPTNIYDPKDPGLPELIVSDGRTLRLDPDWQIAEIEYTYDWWGLSEPALGYEKIEIKNSAYYWNSQEVEPEKIQEFIRAISNLHSAQSLIIGTWHTDDYPTWQLELTGIDGNRVLLYAASNENPGSGPWHIIYNGRIYAQYDGSLGAAVENLFKGTDGSPNRDMSWRAEWHDPNLVGFATEGWPNTLWYGFDGLLPISEGFHYVPNLEISEIRGHIRGRYSIGGFGNMVVGKIDSLHSVTLTVDNHLRSCKTEKLESQDAYSAEWAFSCKVSNSEAGHRYRYPIQIEFGTDSGQRFITDGELHGIWGNLNSFWVIPPPEEVQLALNADPNAQDLLENSVLYISRYYGKFQLDQDAFPTLSGQIVLIGEAEVDGVKIKYSVFTPFIVENNKFTRFGLTEQELKRFLVDVMHSPVTRRILVYYPNATLNLWYAAKDYVSEPKMPNLWTSLLGSFTHTETSACGKTPARFYPARDRPFRMFTFNSDYLWYPWRSGINNIVGFLLVDDRVIVNEIYLSQWGGTDKMELDRLWQLLLPSQLNLLGFRPFLDINYSIRNRILSILPDYRAGEDEVLAYQKSLALLPGQAERLDRWYKVKDISLEVLEDGSIIAVPCNN